MIPTGKTPETARPAASYRRRNMTKELAIKIAKQHFNDVARTRPEDRSEAVREAVKFWAMVVEALENK